MKLYPHQQEALRLTSGLRRVAYYYDMGLGKTFIGSEKMREIGNRINLIVCQKSKVEDWCEHLYNCYNDIAIMNLTEKRTYEAFMLNYNLTNRIIVAVINYELIWRDSRKGLMSLSGFTLMLDESSLIQNRTAKKTRFIMKMNPDAVILLSGTPTSGKYENLWTQCHLLGWDITNHAFQTTYVNWTTIDVGGFPQKIVDKRDPYKNVDRLKRKMREHGCIFCKTEDVMDLPDQQFITLKCHAPVQYRKFMEDSVVTIKHHGESIQLIGDTILSKRLRARQLCGMYCKSKIASFHDLVQSTNARLIVFYSFRAERDELMKACEDRPISLVDGDIKDLKAYEEEDNSVTLIQYQAGAMGLNLQKAHIIVYFTPPERSDLFEQSKKRIHRIGQSVTCIYYMLTAANTIEQDIYRALSKREDYTNDLFTAYETKNY